MPAPTPLWRLILYSLAVCFLVFFLALLMQEAIYNGLLHDKGRLRAVGSTIAALLAFAFVLKYQLDVRKHQRENLRRFEVIAEMNDRIRGAAQALACLKYLSDTGSTDAIRQAVEAIDSALQGFVNDPAITDSPKKNAGAVRNDKAKSQRA